MTEVPYSDAAEKSTILSCFVSPEALYTALERIDAKDFYNTSHSNIFHIIETLDSEGVAVDRTTVLSRITTANVKNVFEGLFTETDVNPVNIETYCDILEENTKLRLALEASYSVQRMVQSGSDNADQIINNTQDALYNATNRRDAKSVLSPTDVLSEVSTNITARIGKSDHDVIGIPSGIECLDNLWLGAEPNDLVIIAGRPSMGKTQLAVQLAIQCALTGKAVLFFSLEMSAAQLMERIISHISGVFYIKIRTGNLTPLDVKKLEETYDIIKTLPIYIDDTAMITPNGVVSKTRRFQQKHGNLGMVVQDYIQLFGSDPKARNRNEELGHISRNFKLLSKSLSIPSIVLSQLSRSCETRGDDKRPILSDLRDSGAIEQDADKVVFVYSDYPYTKRDEHKYKGELILAKHRNGPIGTAHITNDKRIQKFYDADVVSSIDLKPIDRSAIHALKPDDLF